MASGSSPRVPAHRPSASPNMVGGDLGETRAHGGWLVVARLTWIALAAVLLANLIPSIPAYYRVQHLLCNDPANCLTFGQPTPGKLLALQRLGLSLDDFARYSVGLQSVVTLVFLAVAALIFWRKSNTWLGLLASFCLVLLGCFGSFANLSFSSGATGVLLALSSLATLVQNTADLALVVFLLLFPTGRFTPRWTWVVSLTGATNIVVFNLPAPHSFFYWPAVLQASYILLILVSIMAIQIYRYRRIYTPVEQQQAKWLVFGVAAGVVLFAFFGFALPLVPGLNAPDSPLQLLDSVGAALFYISIPLGVGIAVLRYRLWDIDVIINRTLVYGSLTMILAAIYMLGVIGGQHVVSSLTHSSGQEQSPLIVVITTLVIAALFQPLRRRIQSLIDRRFYRRKYDAKQTLAAFSVALREEVDLQHLTRRLLDAIEETMQPAHVSLWLRDNKRPQPGRSA